MNKDRKKNLLLAIILIVGSVLIAMGLYFLFSKKEETPVKPTNPTSEIDVSKDKIELVIDDMHEDMARTIELGNNFYTFKLIKNENEKYELYLNDEKIETLDYSTVTVYLVDRYLIVSWPGAQAGKLTLGYVNDLGNYISIHEKNSIYDIYFESGFMYGNVEDKTSEEYSTKIVKITFTTPSNLVIENVKQD